MKEAPTRHHAAHERFVLTLQGKRAHEPAQTLIWDTAMPMPLGHPFQWVLERTAAGVRIRDVSAPFGVMNTAAPTEIPEAKLADAKSVTLRSHGGRELKLTISPINVPKPAFQEYITGKRSGDKNTVRAFHCRGGWIMDSFAVPPQGEWMASARGEEYFGVRADVRSSKATLTARGKALHWTRGDSKGTLDPGRSMELSLVELGELAVSAGNDLWRFHATLEFTVAEAPSAPSDDTILEFKKSLKIAGSLALAFLVLCFAWPQPEPKTLEEELIPAQYAKVLLKEAQQPASSASNDTATKAADSQVAQAFRSQAVQNSISGLLKGGMTKLLSSSALLSANTSNTRNLFQTSQGAKTADPSIKHKDLKVAQLGGEGKDGYKDGSHAKVAGQGGGSISLDMETAKVEEGLSKDEVGKVIHAHMNEVRYCYDSALIRNPEIRGKLIVAFTIGSGGAVSTSAVQSSALGDARLDDCILRRLAHWKFPTPKGGVNVAVSYPFIFQTLGQ